MEAPPLTVCYLLIPNKDAPDLGLPLCGYRGPHPRRNSSEREREMRRGDPQCPSYVPVVLGCDVTYALFQLTQSVISDTVNFAVNQFNTFILGVVYVPVC